MQTNQTSQTKLNFDSWYLELLQDWGRAQRKLRHKIYPLKREELYNIFPHEFINKAMIRKHTKELNTLEARRAELVRDREEYCIKIRDPQFNKQTVWFLQSGLEETNEELNKIIKKIPFLERQRLALYRANKSKTENKMPIKNKRDIDLDEIKAIPIRDILDRYGIEVHRGNKFRAIWRRDENPSCDYHEDKNAWCDRGAGNEGGSVIDLIMKLENCNCGEAIKLLSEY